MTITSPATTPANAVAALFVSERPRAPLPPDLAAFRPLVGGWDLTVTDFRRDGTVRVRNGEWHFAWALDGRAVADVWITPSRAHRAAQGDGEWGLSLRFHDPGIGALRSTWLGPARAVVMPFVGRARDGRIVLEGSFEPGITTRWMFSDVTAESFAWRAEETDAAGGTFVVQTFAASRRPQAGEASG